MTKIEKVTFNFKIWLKFAKLDEGDLNCFYKRI